MLRSGLGSGLGSECSGWFRLCVFEMRVRPRYHTAKRPNTTTTTATSSSSSGNSSDTSSGARSNARAVPMRIGVELSSHRTRLRLLTGVWQPGKLVDCLCAVPWRPVYTERYPQAQAMKPTSEWYEAAIEVNQEPVKGHEWRYSRVAWPKISDLTNG